MRLDTLARASAQLELQRRDGPVFLLRNTWPHRTCRARDHAAACSGRAHGTARHGRSLEPDGDPLNDSFVACVGCVVADCGEERRRIVLARSFSSKACLLVQLSVMDKRRT